MNACVKWQTCIYIDNGITSAPNHTDIILSSLDFLGAASDNIIRFYFKQW